MARRTGAVVAVALAGLLALGVIASIGAADSGKRSFHATKMLAHFEVPAASSDAQGEFEARLVDDDTVQYTLRYSGLESDVRQAHIHFGQSFAAGGISVWLCETSTTQHPVVDLRAVTPDCGGPRGAEITDSFNAAEVIGPATQGISAGEFSALLEEMRAGVTYANVHSASIPGGEIRAQIKGGDGNND